MLGRHLVQAARRSLPTQITHRNTRILAQEPSAFLNYRIRTMSTSLHSVGSTAEPAAPSQPSGPMPDVTAPHDTAPPPPVAAAPDGEQPKGKPQQQQQKGQPKEKKEKKSGGGGSSGPLEVTPPPQFFEDRIKIFDEYMAKYKQHIAGELPPPLKSAGRTNWLTPRPTPRANHHHPS